MMFSGGGSDSTESQNYTQWALNPSAYQNMQNEQVDWAALAHQWIKMKEAGPPIPTDKMVRAPPPPIISNSAAAAAAAATTGTANKSRKQIEGGEAPMDMENDSDSNLTDSNDSLTWPSSQSQSQSTHQQQSGNWGWNNTAWPPAIQTISGNKTPLLPTPAYNAYSTNANKDETTFSGGFWTGNGSPGSGSGAGPPSSSTTTTSSSSAAAKMLKPHNKRYSKVNVPMMRSNSSQEPTSPTPLIDANKRKQLPAWIREGLEKMERDKLKQIDRTREQEKLDDIEEKKKLRENAMEILKSTAKQTEAKPINDYDDSNDVDEDEDDDENEVKPPPAPFITQAPIVPLTHEEMMLKVRRTMTEILLKVTNREIAQICKEELQRHVRKQKANDQHVTAPSEGANLIARLGLGVYDGSGESSDESDDDNEKTELDSDNELRDTIRRRKEEFAKTERDIENRLAEVEKDNTDAGGKSPASDSSPPVKPLDRRSHTPKTTTRKSTTRKRRSGGHSSRSQSTSSTTSSSDRRSSRKDRHSHRSRSSSRSTDRRRRSRSKKRSPPRRSSRPAAAATANASSKRLRSRSRSNYRRHNDRRRQRQRRQRSDSRSPYRRASRSTSRRRSSRRRTRSKTRSRSRSYDSGRGKRSHRH